MPVGTEKAALLGASAGGFTWDLMDSNCSSTSDGGTWAFSGGSAGGGAPQVTYDSQETFKMDSGGTAADGAYGQAYMALANSDLSSATVWPDPFTMQCRVYIDAFGLFATGAATDEMGIHLLGQNTVMSIRFTLPYTSGPSPQAYGTRWIDTGGSNTLIGNIGDDWQGAWHTVGIYAHSFQESNPLVTASVYIDGVLKNTGLTRNGGETSDAAFYIVQKGYMTTNRITYIVWVRFVTGDGRSVITA